MRIKTALYVFISILILPSNNGHASEANTKVFLSAQEIDVLAGPGSREPTLFVANDGCVYLSWMEPVDDGRYALRFAVHEETGWSRPRTIAEGDNWFVNWSDFPSFVAFGDGSLAAHWRVKNGGNTFYSYDINVAYSTDGGKTWSAPTVPHRDEMKTQHGFVSMLPWSNERLLLVWLDGRNMSGTGPDDTGTGAMTLRFATLDRQGRPANDTLLDERVCTCCQTAAALTSDGVVVAYRDRSQEEIRDISVVRLQQGRWTAPRTLYKDGWEIAGCPINGPAIAAEGQRVAVAWFTAANDNPRVRVAFSNDGGATFGEPIRVDERGAVGRVDIVLLADGAALVSWLELTAKGEEIRLRRVRPTGSPDQAITLVRSRSGRTSGFPRMARKGDKIYFAWTQPGKPLTIRTAVLKLSAP